MNPDRPQAPGYLANLMARLFHEVSGDGLHPLGIRAGQFPVLVQLWFGPGISRAGLSSELELDTPGVDALVRELAEDGLIESYPTDPHTNLTLTAKASAARDAAVTAARRANHAALAVLSEAETETFLLLMNRVIDALQAEREAGGQ